MRHLRAFTVIELLVVVSIITLLLAMLTPMLGRVRLTGETATCLSNMNQMGDAMHAFTVDEKGFLPGPSWYGQQARYTTGSKTLAQHLATYMGYRKPGSTARVNKMFICPSFYRVAPPGYAHDVCVIYGAMSELNDQRLRVFGYPAFEGAPEYGPSRLIVVKSPSKAKAVRDIDYPLNSSAGWAERTARGPMHSSINDANAIRNYLFFDSHAETVTEDLLP